MIQEAAQEESVEFFFDCSSPWTRIAFHSIRPMARDLGLPIRWRPVLLGAVLKAVNPSVELARQITAKQDYVKKDLQDWARHIGLAIVYPPRVFPVNSVKAMRGCLALEPSGLIEPFAEAVFDAYWRQDLDISRTELLADLCEDVGGDRAAFGAAIESPEIKKRLRENTDELIHRGGFGTPTMFLNGRDMYFGNDRLEFLRTNVLANRAAARASA